MVIVVGWVVSVVVGGGATNRLAEDAEIKSYIKCYKILAAK